MSLDVKITGGTIIDGTGRARFHGDVGIKDGVITAVGDIGERADRVIDAEGAIVTPGFVDIHTHYDGQISWDDELAPSVFHGVTTIVMGSCGVGFAPVRERDHDRLIRLMEGVEDIPGSALAEGLSWGWESFPEYMEVIDRRPHSIDFSAQVPHDAVRVFVMGERAVESCDATDDDIAAMRALVRQALEAGAVGFSTGRSDMHRTSDGEWTPASEASARELAGIAAGMRGLDHGVLQAVCDFDYDRAPERFDAEFDILERMVEASGRPFSISLMQRGLVPDQWLEIIKRSEAAAARGLTWRLQVAPRAIGVNLGLQCTFHPFMGFPSYKAISHLPLQERVRQMRDPAFKARLLSEKSDTVAGDGTPIPPLADRFLQAIDMIAYTLFVLDDDPDYEQPMERSLGAQAAAAGKKPLEAVYDAMLADDGRGLIYFPIYNYSEFDYENVLRMMRHPQSLPGLSDGGAHVGTVCDASFPTYLLSYWTRDRARGDQLPLERAVQMLTRDTASHIGYRDRGVLAVGKKADINVIEHGALRLKAPRMVKDLPAGGQRLLQDAIGYRATLVGGQVVIDHDRLTDARPGRLVRLGR